MRTDVLAIACRSKAYPCFRVHKQCHCRQHWGILRQSCNFAADFDWRSLKISRNNRLISEQETTILVSKFVARTSGYLLLLAPDYLVVTALERRARQSEGNRPGTRFARTLRFQTIPDRRFHLPFEICDLTMPQGGLPIRRLDSRRNHCIVEHRSKRGGLKRQKRDL